MGWGRVGRGRGRVGCVGGVCLGRVHLVQL